MIRPFKYLQFEDGSGVRLVRARLRWSLVLSFAVSLLLVFIPNLNIFGSSGLLDKLGSLASSITGFYVAGLVAVATFGQSQPEMDGKMPYGQIKIIENGEPSDVTRREYVTALFGYLVVIAFCISIASIMGSISASAIAVIVDRLDFDLVGVTIFDAIKVFGLTFYLFLVVHLVLETSIGLEYLVDKLYRKHPSVVAGTAKKVRDTNQHNESCESDT